MACSTGTRQICLRVLISITIPRISRFISLKRKHSLHIKWHFIQGRMVRTVWFDGQLQKQEITTSQRLLQDAIHTRPLPMLPLFTIRQKSGTVRSTISMFRSIFRKRYRSIPGILCILPLGMGGMAGRMTRQGLMSSLPITRLFSTP